MKSKFWESRLLRAPWVARTRWTLDPIRIEKEPASDTPKLVTSAAFDPARKTSEGTATDAKGQAVKIVKGAFATLVALAAADAEACEAADKLEKQGFRVLAVAFGPSTALRLIGLIALSDPHRKDSASLVSDLKAVGVQTVIVTGDAPKLA